MATDIVEFKLAPQDFDPAVPLDRLSEHDENYNVGADEALAASLDAHGFYGAVVAQRSTGKILAGNSRYRVAKRKGAAALPVFFVDVDDTEARRILAHDNVTARLAVFDEAKLVALLKRVESDSGSTWGTGYDSQALASLVRHQAAITATPDQDDWTAMPDFDQPSAAPAYSITVHIPSEEFVPEFFARLGVPQPKQRFLWWPNHDGVQGLDYTVVEVQEPRE